MTGERREPHSDLEHVELSPRGDGVFVLTSCHGARVFLPLEDALVSAHLSPRRPRDGRRWLLELIAQETTESGLRAVWTDLEEASQ